MSYMHREPESETDRARTTEKPQSQSEHEQQLPPGIVPEDPLNTDE
jgi:hypothetical protein